MYVVPYPIALSMQNQRSSSNPELTEQAIMVMAKPMLASLMTKIILGRSDSSTVDAAPAAVAESVVLDAV